MKLKVDIRTIASATLEIELTEDELEELAVELGTERQFLEIDDMLDLVYEKIAENKPHICAKCSGWGEKYGLELGDEWDLDSDYDADDAPDARPIRVIE